MSKTITIETLDSTFPDALARDENLRALGHVTAVQLVKLWLDNDKLGIYYRINELDEPLLDILAADFNVSWYYYNGTLEGKRAQIQALFGAHRHLGTKQAIKDAIAGLCNDVEISEWFEYGGEPYHFKLEVNRIEDLDFSEILRRVEMAKRKSAILDTITMFATEAMPFFVGSASLVDIRYHLSFDLS